MKPNILFFLLDSVRADKFYGSNKTSITSNLDALIKNGTYFNQAISSTDATILSLSSFFNSSFPFKINNNRTWKIILKKNNNLEILKNNGYHIFGTIPDLASYAPLSEFCENEDKVFYPSDKKAKDVDFSRINNFNNSLSKKIINFSLDQDISKLYKFFKKKYFIRKIFNEDIPKEVLNRKKHGFAFPKEILLQDINLIEKLLDYDLLTNTDFFKAKYNNFLNKTEDCSQYLWNELILNITLQNLNKSRI